MQIKKHKTLFFVLTCMPLICLAQQNTISPYSAFGIGEVQNQGFALNNDLGGLGVALRPTNNKIKPVIWGCEIPCSGRWTLETKFVPNIFVDIEDYIEQKLQAWSKYIGEARDFPFPRSDEGLITMAKYRGMESGLSYAEGFRSWREVF